MAKRRVVRGWDLSTETATLTALETDNPLVVLGGFFNGNTIDYEPIVGEKESSFLVRRWLSWHRFEATVGGDDAARGGVWVDWAVVKIDTTSFNNLLPGGLQPGGIPLTSDLWVQESSRFLQYGTVWVPMLVPFLGTGIAAGSLPGVSGPPLVQVDLSVNMNVTEDETLVFVFGQPENQSWDVGTSVTADTVLRILLQKRREY